MQQPTDCRLAELNTGRIRYAPDDLRKTDFTDNRWKTARCAAGQVA
jgi:hypothetical protein